MRGSPVTSDGPSLESRLAELDTQLSEFETALRAHRRSHGRVRDLELELAGVVERGAAAVRDLASLNDRVREAADAAARQAAAAATGRVSEFESRAAHVLAAYGEAVRAARQAVARAEARIDAFDERVAHQLSTAAQELREASQLVRDRAARDESAPERAPHTRTTRLLPAALAALLVVAMVGAYNWVARTLDDASDRAAAAERQMLDARRDAHQQIASIERAAQEASRDAVARASRAERLAAMLASGDARRMTLAAQQRAPGASGEVLWSPRDGVVITAAGLPPLPADETYQVWLVTTRDIVSLGVVAPDAGGRATAAFDLPRNLAASVYGFMLTREPSRGSPRPSRTVVLAS